MSRPAALEVISLDGLASHQCPSERKRQEVCAMYHDEASQLDIAGWVKSILPSELWDRYCHLTYAQMARIPELAEYAEDLRAADRNWLRTRRMSLH
jgi:hypothetical protein